MTLTLEDKSEMDLQTSNAPLSSSTRRYYYAGFSGKSKIQTCKMDGENADKTDKTDSTEPTVDQTKPTTPNPCETSQTKTSASEFIDTGVPKMNFMNLLVTGLRILLAKCVAVNVMMTVKAFVF